jgi:hypothetical protein
MSRSTKVDISASEYFWKSLHTQRIKYLVKGRATLLEVRLVYFPRAGAVEDPDVDGWMVHTGSA